jgi:hypothetical protein
VGAARLLGTLCACALAPVVAAGCGSDGGSAESTTTTTNAVVEQAPLATGAYSRVRTQRCLNAQPGLHAYNNPNNQVVMGSGGELRVTFGFGRDWIYVAFGKDAAEARAIRERAVEAATSHNAKLDRKTVLASVRLKRNVFYYADGGPVTIAEGRQIEACLR